LFLEREINMDGATHFEQAKQRANGAQKLAKQAVETFAKLAENPDMGDDEAVAVIMGSVVGYASAVVGMLGANVAANLAIAAAIAPQPLEASGAPEGAPEVPDAGNDVQRAAQRAAEAVGAVLDAWRSDNDFMFVKRRDEEAWAELRERVLGHIRDAAR
jgi:hypothetical protein